MVRGRYAEEALKLHAVCPEAYVLKALRCSTSLEQALQWYRQAEELGPRVAPTLFEKAVAERSVFEHHPLRAYYRAVHGVASTLRKMGQHAEALTHFQRLQELDDHLYARVGWACWWRVARVVVVGWKRRLGWRWRV